MMRALLLLAGMIALDAQSLAISHLGLTSEQLAAIIRNGKDYDSAAKASGARSEALSKELQRETTASPLNVVRLDILHTESVMLQRESDRREAAVVAANQALLTPAQVEKVRVLERDEEIGFLIFPALSAGVAEDPCAGWRTGTEIAPALVEYLGLDGPLLKELQARNDAFEKSLREQEIQHSNNAYRITNLTRERQIDVEELGRLYAAQIAIDREIAAQRKRHTQDNRTLLPATVLARLQRIETAWRLEWTRDEARALHLLKSRNGYFYRYGSCQ